MSRGLAVILSGWLVALLMCPAPAPCAEYDGVCVDGTEYDCTAYSYDTSNYYQVTVVFSGSEATICFPNGHTRDLTLDDEEIDDPTSISAYEYETGVYWELEVEGIE